MNSNTNIQKPTNLEVNNSKSELFFERFSTLLENAGLTQSQLAEKVGQCRQYIWAIAHLRQIPKPALKIKIAKTLRTDTICIWGNYEQEVQNG